jgi:hypothetical protein
MSLSHYFPRDKHVMGVSSRGYHPVGGVIESEVSYPGRQLVRSVIASRMSLSQGRRDARGASSSRVSLRQGRQESQWSL